MAPSLLTWPTIKVGISFVFATFKKRAEDVYKRQEVSRTRSVLYVTGEESVRQIKLRAVRLDVPQDNISIVAESDVDEICGLIEQMKPDLVVIDSIQTMRCTDVASSSGTVSQVKDCLLYTSRCV